METTQEGHFVHMPEDNDQITSKIMETMGFCGCGKPWDSAEYIIDVLLHIEKLRTHVWEKKMTFREWKIEGQKLFPNDGAAYFAYYVLDEKELIEHGGSVPGWLTPKGYELLKLYTSDEEKKA